MQHLEDIFKIGQQLIICLLKQISSLEKVTFFILLVFKSSPKQNKRKNIGLNSQK